MGNYHYKFTYIENLEKECLENLKTIQRDKLDVGDSFKKWKGGILYKIRQSGWIQSLFYYLKLDYMLHILSKSYKAEIEKALNDYLSEKEVNNIPLRRKLRKDIIRCDRLIMARPYEYFFLRLRNLSKSRRKEFVTDKYMLQRMSMTGKRKLHDVELNDKYNFYLLAKPFFQRKVVKLTSTMSFSDFSAIVSSSPKMIFKPTIFGCGQGIFIADLTSEEKLRKTYKKIVNFGGEWVAEDIIIQSDEMAQWNKSSVNTVRLLTFCNSEGIHIATSFMRTGRFGSMVDNGGQGGIFAAIDGKSGEIITDGHDEMGKSYKSHPDSNKIYLGWKIPRWEELKETAIALHSTVFPYMKYIGWDFALTDAGWVVIEGNWGQFLHQSALGYGLRPIFDKYIK